jgi:hypothetical protein
MQQSLLGSGFKHRGFSFSLKNCNICASLFRGRSCAGALSNAKQAASASLS